MTKIKKDDFHEPFLKNLVFVGLVTIVSMISARYLLYNIHFLPEKTRIFTSSNPGSTSNQ